MNPSAPSGRRPRRRLPALRCPRRLAAVAAAGAAAYALAGLPAPAQAGCGGVQTARPRHHTANAPLAVGDSTMLLALPVLSREGFAVNAHGCRQFDEALALLRSMRRANTLPGVVLIALGADGTVTDSDVDQTLSILGSRRMLVLVTPRELGGGSGSDAVTVRNAARRYPTRVRVLDWVAHSGGHSDWFQPDGVHLTFSGADAFARFLRPALSVALPPLFVSLTGRAAPASGWPAVRFRARVPVPSGWSVVTQRVHAGLPDVDLDAPSPCPLHIRLSAVLLSAPDATGALQRLVPSGWRAGTVHQRGGGAWQVWSRHGRTGGASVGPLGSGTGSQAFLAWNAVSVRGGPCGAAELRQVEARLGRLLEGLRAG